MSGLSSEQVELIDELMERKKWRPLTKKGYRYDIERFFKWINSEGIPWNMATESDLLEYLNAHDWGASTQHNAICAIRALYRFHLGRAKSPAEGIGVSRPKPRRQRTLEREEVMQVLASFDTSSLVDVRNIAIFLLALDSGMRNSELCRATVDNLNLDEGYLSVEIKGGRVARKLFGEYTAHWIGQWLALRMAGNTVREIFVAVGGSKPGTAMSPESMRTIFYGMAKKAGVRKFSPHAMRRTGATELLRSGASTRATQLWGDWESLEMPERYSMALEKDFVRDKLPVDILMGVNEAADES